MSHIAESKSQESSAKWILVAIDILLLGGLLLWANGTPKVDSGAINSVLE